MKFEANIKLVRWNWILIKEIYEGWTECDPGGGRQQDDLVKQGELCGQEDPGINLGPSFAGFVNLGKLLKFSDPHGDNDTFFQSSCWEIMSVKDENWHIIKALSSSSDIVEGRHGLLRPQRKQKCCWGEGGRGGGERKLVWNRQGWEGTKLYLCVCWGCVLGHELLKELVGKTGG